MSSPISVAHGMHNGLVYRTDIDGLRAIAVLSVLFYHAGLGFPGGYVGVDVFFVISGYLITALILKDLERESFSMANFWERRIRRIFPALAVMVAVTMAAGWFLLLPDDLSKLGASVIAQSLLVSNFYFWRTTNYFGGANEEKPLLHTWSLAVEEQFYLIFPIALMAFWWAWSRWQKAQAERRSKLEDKALAPRPSPLDSRSPATSNPLPATSPLGDTRRWTLFWLFAAVALLSFGLSIWGVKAQPFATFFLLPTRAWELLLGSMLAVLPATVVVRNAALREILCLAGLAAIFMPVFFYGEQTPFPGLAALPPCLGTVALIWANKPAPLDIKSTCVAHTLSLRPLVFIGLISYSLYLWHWPIFAFLEYWKTYMLSGPIKILGIAASFILAVLTWKFVENPIRRNRGIVNRKTVFAVFVCATAILAATGGLQVRKDGFPSRLSEVGVAYMAEIQNNAHLREKFESKYFDKSQDQTITFGAPENPVILGASDAQISFLVVGDSHARHLAPVIHRIGIDHGFAVAMISHSATPPLAGWRHVFRGISVDNPEVYFENILEFAKEKKIKTILLAGFWSYYEKNVGADSLKVALRETSRKMHENGFEARLLLGQPTYDVKIPRQEIKEKLLSRTKFYRQKISDHHIRNSAVYWFAENNPSIPCIDPVEKFLLSSDSYFLTSYQGKPLYSDDNHLSYFGVEYVWEGLLDDLLSKKWK
jgi:peptidoglycan/LPS O-acetylase OafA/YrhL